MHFSIRNHKVLLDGKETVILSGAIHYFRIHPELWADRLLKLKQCGFNTVETYLAWHLHEVREGEFDFSGNLDFVRFIKEAENCGLMVMVRPGPYICSECDLGGLPGWLLGKERIRLRCNNPSFMAAVKSYFDHALPLLKDLQCTHGGPVIAMQVENEYGSYAADKEYLRNLTEIIRDNGIDIQLFTSDGPTEGMLKGGTLPDLPATVNFRNNPKAAFRDLDKVDTSYANAHVCMELWCGKGWHWGVQRQHHEERDVAQDIRDFLSDRASVNCYMFHGGTNFGFASGANFVQDTYMPMLTSYEVDAILDEGGKPTAKYFAVQKVIEEYFPGTTAPPSQTEAAALPPVELTEFAPLLGSLPVLSEVHEKPLPETMEYFGQSFGFIHYETTVNRYQSGNYTFRNMRDRAMIFVNGIPAGVINRNDRIQQFFLQVPKDGSKLEILVENMGRINFGMEMEAEYKGMTGLCLADQMMQLTNWKIRPLPLNDLSALQFSALPERNCCPGFYRTTFKVKESRDTYLQFPDGVRGYVWLNGFNLGRYWNIGPQYSLYIPGPLLKKDCDNELIVFDLHGLRSTTLHFASDRIFDPAAEMILSD